VSAADTPDAAQSPSRVATPDTAHERRHVRAHVTDARGGVLGRAHGQDQEDGARAGSGERRYLWFGHRREAILPTRRHDATFSTKRRRPRATLPTTPPESRTSTLRDRRAALPVMVAPRGRLLAQAVKRWYTAR